MSQPRDAAGRFLPKPKETNSDSDSVLIDLNKTLPRENLTSEDTTMEMSNDNYFSLGAAVKLIPSFSGGNESDLSSFETKCEFVLENISAGIRDKILKAIITQLTGAAYEAVRYHEISTWEALKTQLRTTFGTAHSIPYLQIELSSMKQRDRESIKEFANRVEKTSHELTHALTLDKLPIEAGIIAKTIRAHALSVFVSGIPYNIRLIVKARNVPTFEEAVLIAVEEEKSFEKPERNWDRNKFDRNKFDKNKNNKKNIKCHRCSKFGHYSNECRTSMNINFRNPNFNQETRPEVKREYSGSHIKFCHYCKKNNHTISECRKLKFKEEKKKELGESSGTQNNRTVSEIKNNTIRIITPLDKEHVTCSSRNFEPNSLKFLLDSGADMCVIKLSTLNENIVVNEQQKRSIKGITALSIDTYGTVIIPITINGLDFITKFDVVHDDFPVPEAGIIGRDFIKENKIVIDLSQELIVIPEIQTTFTEQLILPPRSNCVLLIQKDEVVDHEIITIKNQEINDKVIIANSVSPVLGNKVVSNIINISEQPFIIEDLTTSNLQWEPYQEQVYVTQAVRNDTNRIKILKTEINTEHLNTEEQDSLLQLCNNYSDLFFLEGELVKSIQNDLHNLCQLQNHLGCKFTLKIARVLTAKIEEKKELIFNSVGHRGKRDLLTKIAKAAQLLYGMCNNECINSCDNNIKQMIGTNTDQLKLITKQIKILQLRQYEQNKKIDNIMYSTIKSNINETNSDMTRNTILEHLNTINIMITQHLLETETLIEIVQSAKIGQIHPSLIGPTELMQQFKDIKVSLPSGTDMPIDLEVENTYELLRLSDLDVYYSNNNLVFIVKIPLVYQNEFTLYNLIPKPVSLGDTHYMYIKPSYNFLTVSRSKELYSTYDNFNYAQCKQTHDFLLCPEINPLHPRSTRPICEIQLLQEPKEVPSSCEIMHVRIATTIFHKLQYKNAWLYTTKGEMLFISCDADKESSSYNLEGVGIIQLNNTCKGYASRDVLIPGKVENEKNFLDFVPKSIIKIQTDFYPKDIVEDKHVKNNGMEDLNTIANSEREVGALTEQEEKIKEVKQNQKTNNYLLYVTLTISIFSAIFFIIAFIQKLVKNKVQRRTENEQYAAIQLEQHFELSPSAPLRKIVEIPEPEPGDNEPSVYSDLKKI